MLVNWRDYFASHNTCVEMTRSRMNGCHSTYGCGLEFVLVCYMRVDFTAISHGLKPSILACMLFLW